MIRLKTIGCPELTLGIYTSEEVLDGDFKEYFVENLSEKVQEEIEQNANQVEFETNVDAAVVENNNKQEQSLPDFMVAEQ